MSSDFVSRFAPHLSFVSPQEDSGGMPGPDNHPYDNNRMPLPYIQEQGGQRTYYNDSGVADLRGYTPSAPTEEFLGFTPPSGATIGPDDLRGRSTTTPGPGTTRPMDPAPPVDGLRGRIGLDPDVPPTQDVLDAIGVGPNAPNTHPSVRIPQLDPRVAENRIVEGIRTGRINPEVPRNGGLLEGLLAHYNFQLPSNKAGSTSVKPDTVGDPDPTKVRVQARPSTQTNNTTGPAAEIEALLRSRNVRLTPEAGVRTRNALPGDHPTGRGIDVPPNELETAIRIIRADPRFRDLPLRPMFIRRGQRFSNGVVATGDHYHLHLGPPAQR